MLAIRISCRVSCMPRPRSSVEKSNGFLNRVSQVRFLPGAPSVVVFRVMLDGLRSQLLERDPSDPCGDRRDDDLAGSIPAGGTKRLSCFVMSIVFCFGRCSMVFDLSSLPAPRDLRAALSALRRHLDRRERATRGGPSVCVRRDWAQCGGWDVDGRVALCVHGDE
jgi:hypothetical protein